jgi:8-oxo-dGTP pyrophosphatase MutT (NUDIX family)
MVEGFPAGALPETLANVTPVPSRWGAIKPEGIPGPAPHDEQRKPPRLSAVALLFLPPRVEGVAADVALIRRGAHYGSHRGQIGLAGGRAEPSDAGPVDTLLRELREELGIPGEVLMFHGQLPARRAIDGSVVLPCVVTANFSRDRIKAAPDEVASVHFAPWTALTRSARDSFVFTMFGVRRESSLYRVDGVTVWGLTASIISAADMLPPGQ